MVLTLKQNTQILHYLQQKNLDRLILNDFLDEKTITNTNSNLDINLSDNGVIYNKSYMIQDTDNIIFKFPKILFNKFQKLRITIEATTDIDLNKLECFLSVAESGQLKNVPIDLIDPDIITSSNFRELIFKLDFNEDSNYWNDLSNIQSIILDFNEVISCNIHDIVIFDNEYDTSLEMIETAYNEAKNYISEWLDDSQIKEKSTQNAIAKLSAINLWLITKKDGKSGAMGEKDYYDRLLIQVENILKKFNPDFNKDPKTDDDSKPKINENLIGSI